MYALVFLAATVAAAIAAAAVYLAECDAADVIWTNQADN